MIITERPLNGTVRVETLTRTKSPFVLGNGILGYTQLAPAGEPQPWREWADDITQITTRRGGGLEGVTVRNQPGLLNITIRGVELDRSAPQLYREQPIRVLHVGSGKELFTGWVRVIEQHYMPIRLGHPTPEPFLTVTAVDAVARHDETDRYGALSPDGGESLAERVERLQRSAAAPVEIPTDPYLNTAGEPIKLATTVYESSLSNHFTIAANTAGAMWYVDAAGVTRFQPRVFDPAGAVKFSNYATGDPAELFAVAYTPIAATESGYNAITGHNKTAERDPETGDWDAVETTHDLLPGYISLLGRVDAILETNAVVMSDVYFTTAWVQPNMFGWGTLLGSIRWNAQEDLSRIPELDIGASVSAAAFTPNQVAWNQYIVIGVQHDITPTRWMTTLTVIGAQ